MPTQSDVALENQKAIEKANDRRKDEAVTEDDKATRFDGDPRPISAGGGTFKPQDDTPMFLEKKETPKK